MNIQLNFWMMLLIAMLSTSLFTSCIDDSPAEAQAYGDALIRVIKQGDSLVYNVQLYTYSWYAMNEVSAQSSLDSTVTIFLDSINFKYTYAHLPERSTYSSEKPEEQEYYFSVLFESGEELIVDDYLDSSTVNPVDIETLAWDDEDEELSVEWSVPAKADYFKVLLFDEEQQIVFESDLLNRNVTEIDINRYSYGWYTNKQAEVNATYKLAVNAYLFEPMASSFDVQCIAVNDENTFEWTADDN